MALPDDQATRLRCYKCALRNWAFEGYIAPKVNRQGTRLVEEWLASELPQFTWRDICREMHVYVKNGGQIDEQVEKRPEYVSDEFHYDLRVRIGGRHIYFETVLLCDDADNPDEPMIVVVNVHDV